MPGLHTNRGAKRAREARDRFGLDAVSPVACLLTLVEREAGLPVVVGAMPDHVAGALVRNGAGSVAFVNGSQGVERQRFTLAHELGHACIGHEKPSLDTFETVFGSTHVPEEVEANAFAAELLAPREGVRAVVGAEPGLEDVVRVAARFGISTIAALYRLKTLGLVTGERAERLHAEIDERLHVALWDHLGLEPMRDELAAIEHPRLSPALEGSALAAALRGELRRDGALAEAAAALSR